MLCPYVAVFDSQQPLHARNLQFPALADCLRLSFLNLGLRNQIRFRSGIPPNQ